MGLRIQTNISSLNAQNQLIHSTNALRDSMVRLSSGSRINRSADDAAGLAVSENLRGDIRSLTMAKKNALDGVSLVQTAEGGLVESSNMLVRLRELAVQAASDTIGDKERGFLDKEFIQLKYEIDRIANSTEFNGTYLLVGKNEMPPEMIVKNNPFPLEVQVGKDYFAQQDGLQSVNPVNVIRLDFSNLNAFSAGEGSLDIGTGEEGARVSTKQMAQSSIAVVDAAVQRMAGYRANLGAIQNRLFSTINNLGTQLENLSEAQSRIRDTDYASETANLTKANIMQQAGTAVLSMANSQPQIALSLLNMK